MTTPPLLLGASLIYWGWHTGLMPLAIIMAALLEGSRLVRFRIELSARDFRRISDLSTLILAGIFIYLFATRQSSRIIFAFFQWTPIGLLPMMLAQVYSASGKIDLGAIFWAFRKKVVENRTSATQGIDMSYPYLAIVMLSAGASNIRTLWFYAGLFLLVAWSLWSARSRRTSVVLWIMLLTCSAIVGYGGHVGLNRLQAILSDKAPSWFVQSGDQDLDAYRSTTAIGDMGVLKMSDWILFRVKSAPGYGPPALLRCASYNTYRSSIWVASQANFTAVPSDTTGTSWKLGTAANGRLVTVLDYLKGGAGMLKLPLGSFEISDLPVGKLEKNPFAAVKVSDGPGMVRYTAKYSPNAVLDAPPAASDLTVPGEERPHIAMIARELNLAGKSPTDALKKVEDFFEKKFLYSLVLGGSVYDRSSLKDFLLKTRAGHCEFFATATVLLLREAGIPARYATGFSVQEFSRMEARYVIRERHAHAWALAFVDGAWRDVDTTSSNWADLEKANASWWTPVSDLWSLLKINVSQWRWQERDNSMTGYFLWALIVLVILIAVMLLKRKPVTRLEKEHASAESRAAKPGQDSEFYEIEKRLTEMGHIRHPWEPLSAWLARIEEYRRTQMTEAPAPSLLDLHYRLRFDPVGLTEAEQIAFKEVVRLWLQQIVTEREHR